MNKREEDVFTCLEATGIYSFDLAQYLSQKKINVMVVNPMITHAFFKMELNRNKTDKDYEAIQRLVTRCDQLEKSKTQENNCLEASVNKETSRFIKRFQKAINSELVRVKKAISDMVKNNESLRQQVDLLISIKGIGERTAWSILAYIGDINFFSNSKQIARYAGLTPKIIESGTSINKSSLSKLGHKRLRKSLYMLVLVAI